MPNRKKANKKKRQRKRRQLLERSRRSRDDLINSALEETDVVALVPPSSIHNCSFSSVISEPLEPFTTPATPKCGGKRRQFINSTPRRRRSMSAERKRPVNTCLVLSPVISVDDEVDLTLQQNYVSSSDTPKSFFKWTPHAKWINFKAAFVSFLNAVSNFFHNLYLSVTSLRVFEPKQDATLKLDEILRCLTELNRKQDLMNEKQDGLIARVANLESKMASGVVRVGPPAGAVPGGPPPPPPPLPPPMAPMGDLATPLPLVIVKRSGDGVPSEASRRQSRPSITLEDILNVQLKKTPVVKPFSERTPLKGQKGPLVSVDMLRSVKLKPASLRRQSLERPLQSPSTIFQEKTVHDEEEEDEDET